ncbi:PIH1 domain-containing protein 1 [Strongylocentrotus purpuratus]|uniref:PIH1 domain-containing protein 1 n=1 Tax=Strongylocentrotus purpuratus TaxID=7668 RepID=A0A7M7NVY1_STRPU|nr:PIH1 domain-containing protein 1 [Strongylocentrotus purpuratus]
MAAPMATEMKGDKSLLDLDEESLYKHLLLQANENAGGLFGNATPDPSQSEVNVVTPEPGVCIKTKDNSGKKVFINLCKTTEMPAPADMKESELIKLLDSDELSDYRVPLSIGEPHAEIDNSGNGCTAYDVMINNEFFEKVEKSNLFKGFLMSVVFEGLEQKYNILLQRGWSQMKKRKCLGTLHQHHLRTKSKPRILDMGSTHEDSQQYSPQDNQQSSKPLITEISSDVKSSKVTEVIDTNSEKAPEPKYIIMREPIDGHPEFLVVDVELPGVKTANTLTVDLGEDRILLHAHPKAYHLDIYLPFDVDQDFSGSQFNRDTQTLTLTLPVQPQG